MKKSLVPSLLVMAVAFGCATASQPLPTHPSVNLERYVGTWYEQARLPNRFQKACSGEVRADYALQPGGGLGVTNQCRTATGETRSARGEGRLARFEPQDPAKLEVRFAPAWTAWLPMVWGDYWIIRVEGDYQYALVGTPNRKYLWVLSRDKQADPATVAALLRYADELGFAVDEIQKSGQ